MYGGTLVGQADHDLRGRRRTHCSINRFDLPSHLHSRWALIEQNGGKNHQRYFHSFLFSDQAESSKVTHTFALTSLCYFHHLLSINKKTGINLTIHLALIHFVKNVLSWPLLVENKCFQRVTMTFSQNKKSLLEYKIANKWHHSC